MPRNRPPKSKPKPAKRTSTSCHSGSSSDDDFFDSVEAPLSPSYVVTADCDCDKEADHEAKCSVKVSQWASKTVRVWT